MKMSNVLSLAIVLTVFVLSKVSGPSGEKTYLANDNGAETKNLQEARVFNTMPEVYDMQNKLKDFNIEILN